jgi:flagellar hook-length control protein FliK
MQINLSDSFLKPAGETTAKSSDAAAAGSADSFFAQIGQMMNADSPETNGQSVEDPDGQSAALCCTDSGNLEAGDPASLFNSIDAETVQKLDWTISDTPTLWDMAIVPETDAGDAVPQFDCGDANSNLPSRTPEKTESGEEPTPIEICDTISESSPLPMYFSGSLTAISAMPIKGDGQNIDSNAEPEVLKSAISDTETKPVNLDSLNKKISDHSNNLFKDALSGLQSEEATSGAEDGNPDAINRDLPDMDSFAPQKATTTPSAAVAMPVKEKMAFPKSETSQKGLPVDPVPAADPHRESESQPFRTLMKDGAEAADRNLRPQSPGTSERTSSAIPTVRKPEQGVSVSVDTEKTESPNAAPTASKDEAVVHALLQARSENGLTASPGKSQPPGTERAQEVPATALHNSARPSNGSSAAAAAEPAAPAQPRQFIHQLADQIQVLVRDGKGDIRIQLKPDVLGRIEIKAQTTPAGVVARITTETSTVKSYLENNIQVLQQTLADQGLRIDRIQIVSQDSFDAQFSSGRNAHFGQAGSGRNGQNSESFGRAAGSRATGVVEEIALDRAAWLSMNPNNRFYTVA